MQLGDREHDADAAKYTRFAALRSPLFTVPFVFSPTDRFYVAQKFFSVADGLGQLWFDNLA